MENLVTLTIRNVPVRVIRNLKALAKRSASSGDLSLRVINNIIYIREYIVEHIRTGYPL